MYMPLFTSTSMDWFIQSQKAYFEVFVRQCADDLSCRRDRRTENCI